MIRICTNAMPFWLAFLRLENEEAMSEQGILAGTGTDSPLRISRSELNKEPNHECGEENHAYYTSNFGNEFRKNVEFELKRSVLRVCTQSWTRLEIYRTQQGENVERTYPS